MVCGVVASGVCAGGGAFLLPALLPPRLRCDTQARCPGHNRYTYGLALAALAVLVLCDLLGAGVMLLELFCIDSGSLLDLSVEGPKCIHIGFYCMLLVPPFAIVAAPVSGFIAVASQAPSVARSVCWVALWPP